MKPAGRIRGRDRPGRRTRKGPGENLVGAFGLASDFFEVPRSLPRFGGALFFGTEEKVSTEPGF